MSTEKTAAPATEEKPVKQWVCPVCGYAEEGTEPPAVCPLCGIAGDGFFAV